MTDSPTFTLATTPPRTDPSLRTRSHRSRRPRRGNRHPYRRSHRCPFDNSPRHLMTRLRERPPLIRSPPYRTLRLLLQRAFPASRSCLIRIQLRVVGPPLLSRRDHPLIRADIPSTHGLTNGLQSIGQIRIGSRGTVASIHSRARSSSALSHSHHHCIIIAFPALYVCMFNLPVKVQIDCVVWTLHWDWANCGSKIRGCIRETGEAVLAPIAICADRDRGEANCAIQDLPCTYSQPLNPRP